MTDLQQPLPTVRHLRSPAAAVRREPGRDLTPAASGKILMKKIAGTCLRGRFIRRSVSPEARLILMYHQVVPGRPATDHRAGMEVAAATLAVHLAELARHFELVPLARIIDPEPHERPLCALTFDDGWRDNYEAAFPVLRRFGVPATIFLPAALIGTGRKPWFARVWELAETGRQEGKESAFVRFFESRIAGWARPGMAEGALSALIEAMLDLKGTVVEELLDQAFRDLAISESTERQLLSWNEAARMGRAGISFGSHGLRHHALPALSPREKEEEIGGSLAILREKGLPLAPFFCFPNGRWDDESLALLADAGYRGGVTTEMGCNSGRHDPFLLRRIALHDHIASTPALLWFRFWQAGLAGLGKRI